MRIYPPPGEEARPAEDTDKAGRPESPRRAVMKNPLARSRIIFRAGSLSGRTEKDNLPDTPSDDDR